MANKAVTAPILASWHPRLGITTFKPEVVREEFISGRPWPVIRLRLFGGDLILEPSDAKALGEALQAAAEEAAR